jgi:hypothetical protein
MNEVYNLTNRPDKATTKQPINWQNPSNERNSGIVVLCYGNKCKALQAYLKNFA